MKIKTKVELTEQDLLELIAEKFNLDPYNSRIEIYKSQPSNDPRETTYSYVTVEGVQKQVD
jgi:hypothetical protein